jgi:hypothetical protein
MKIEWIEGSEIAVHIYNKEVTVSANKEGLLSLAGQIKALAEGVPGDHIHYDEDNSLEEGSAELVIERVKSAEGNITGNLERVSG